MYFHFCLFYFYSSGLWQKNLEEFSLNEIYSSRDGSYQQLHMDYAVYESDDEDDDEEEDEEEEENREKEDEEENCDPRCKLN